MPAETSIVDLWVATAHDSLATDWAGTVPASVRGQLANRRPVERDRRIVQLALRRTAIAAHVGQPLEKIELALPGEGRPTRWQHGVWLSASHHDDLTVLGIGTAPLGVDVEPVDESDWDAALDAVLTDAELADLRALPRGDQPEAYFACWTLKEAVMKALGQGISDRDPRSIEVAVLPAPPALLRLDAAAPAEPWALRTVSVSGSYQVSLAVRGVNAFELRRHVWPVDLPPGYR